ncbi:MAG: hypothetical protein EA380_08260 [Phycisphaeraceae bacterium]|nr:MAG: hypothetical protein EA380_08260 [Phycisphaeraceae bacterium]
MNAATLAGYIKRCMAQTLESVGVVVMENPGSHEACGVEEAIGAMGASVWWLPPHSPDLDLIERLWSKIELWLCRAMAWTLDAPALAAGRAFRGVRLRECAKDFR